MEETLRIRLFSHDLVNYCLEKHSCLHRVTLDPCLRGAMGASPFVESVGQAVTVISRNYNIKFLDLCDIVESDIEDNSRMLQNCLTLAHLSFQNGYTPEVFLLYCSMLCFLISYLSTMAGYFHVCRLVVESIASLLTAYSLTGEFKKYGGWKGLEEVANIILSSEPGKTISEYSCTQSKS